MGKVFYYDKFDWVLFGNASMVIGMDEITGKKYCTRANRRLWVTDQQTKCTFSCLNFNQLMKDDYYKRTLQIQAEMGAYWPSRS